MSKFTEMYTQTTDIGKREQLMQRAIITLNDLEKRQYWQQKLDKEYGVKRSLKKGRVIPINILKIMAIAASFLVLIVAANQYIFSPASPTALAESFLQSSDIEHPGVLKGVALSDESNRLIAIQAYDNKEFSKAAQYFELLTIQTIEDKFFAAVSRINIGQYDQAIRSLTSIRTDSDAYDQEATWLLGIAYVLKDQSEDARDILLTIQPSDWQYERAQQLLKKLSK